MEFALPIRVRWDIGPAGDSAKALRIATRIRDVEPLFVELSVDDPRELPILSPILETFSGGFTQLSLTLGLFPGAAEAASGLSHVETAWRIVGLSDLDRLPAGAGSAVFVPDAETIARLPSVLDAFSRSAAKALHLPNINAVRALADTGRVPVPSPAQYASFEKALEAGETDLGNRRLVVHDYFLWRILARHFPGSLGERLEFGGCQAGGALAYVDPAGGLYPCDALPLRLGDLSGDASFRELWDAPARIAAVAAIGATPTGCAGCEALPACRAGCRGLSLVAKGTLDAPDPACPGQVRSR